MHKGEGEKEGKDMGGEERGSRGGGKGKANGSLLNVYTNMAASSKMDKVINGQQPPVSCDVSSATFITGDISMGVNVIASNRESVFPLYLSNQLTFDDLSNQLTFDDLLHV